MNNINLYKHSFDDLKNELNFVYWWKPKKKYKLFPRPNNIGDALSLYVVGGVLRELGVSIKKNYNERKLLAIGSILNHASTGDVIWGTGFNSNHNRDKYNFENLSVTAVRGPKTKDFLNSFGIHVPEIYGDPGLLTSRYIKVNVKKDLDYLVIPHYNEPIKKYKYKNILETKGDVSEFVKNLCRAKKVISSSLHGVIIAESYGIPAVLLINNNGEGIEKYHDYYLGTDRNNFRIFDNLDDAINTDIEVDSCNLKNVQERLLNAFPCVL